MLPGPLRFVLGAILLYVVAAWTVRSIAPTDVKGLDAPPTEFSAARAKSHIDAIAKTPHPVGTPAHDQVRDYVLGELRSLGLDPEETDTRSVVRAAAIAYAVPVRDIIARLRGTRAGPAILLAAHYDSVPESRGASDDASGVATLLETARALKAGPPLENDVLFVFTDAEELGASGAVAFTRDELVSRPVAVALNFEARGTSGAVALYDTSTSNASLIQVVAASCPKVVSSSLLGSLARALPNDSDATIWKRARIPTLAFAYVDHLYQYHRYTDSIDALDLRSLQHDGDYALPLVRALGERHLPLADQGAVAYFDVLGRTLIAYSTATARFFALVTLLAYGWLARRAARDGASLRSVLGAAAWAAGAVVAAVAASGVVHAALHVLGDPFAQFARPALRALAAVAAAVGTFLVAVAWLRRSHVPSVVVGALAPWALLLLVTGALVPEASFVLQWPLLFAILGALVWLVAAGRPSARTDLALALGLVPTAFFWSHLGYTLFVMVGPQAPEAVAFAAVMPLLLAMPALLRIDLARPRVAVATLATAGLLTVAAALYRCPDVPRPDSLVYWVVRPQKQGTWTTTSAEHDDFVAQRVPRGRKVKHEPAADLEPLIIESHAMDEGQTRHSSLTLRSPRASRCLRVWELTDEKITRARIFGQEITELSRFTPEIDEALVRLWSGGAHPSAWVAEACGQGENPVTFELESRAGKPLKLRVIEVSEGLPGPPLVPRGPKDGYPEPDSDTTEVTVDLTL